MKARQARHLLRVAAVPLTLLLFTTIVATSVGIARREAGFTPASSVHHGVVLLVTVSVLLAGAGLVLALRQPPRTSWALLLLAAATWLVTEWSSPGANSAFVFSTGLALNALTPAVLAHLALAFPTARPRGSAASTLVMCGYVVTGALLGIVPSLTYDPQAGGCLNCSRNLWLVQDDARLTYRWDRAALVCGVVWSGTVVAVLGWRLLRSSPAGRRLLGPVQALGAIYLLLVSAAYLHGVRYGYLGSDITFQRLWVGQGLALAGLAVAIPLGLVADRRAYLSLAWLSLALGSPTEGGGLAVPLGSRLGDPELAIAYTDGRGHVDASGTVVDLAALAAGRVTTPLTRDGTTLATIVHQPGVLDSPYAVADLASATYLALENEQLRAVALAQLADLQSTGRRLVSAGDEARSQLERDLHDGAQQRLIGIALGLRMLRSPAPSDAATLADAEDEMRAAISDLRLLARGLYPAILREWGLRAALISLSESRHLRIRDLPSDRYPAVVEATAYLLALRSSAIAPTTVTAATDDSALVVTVTLDGDGRSLDISEIRDRATALDGQLTVSPAQTRTHLVLTLPLKRAEDTNTDGAPG